MTYAFLSFWFASLSPRNLLARTPLTVITHVQLSYLFLVIPFSLPITTVDTSMEACVFSP
jgi:hypothetical protein